MTLPEMFGRVPAGAAQAATVEGTSQEPVNAQGTDTRNPLLVPVFSAEDRRPVDSLADTPQNKRNRNETTFTFEGGLIGAVFLQFKPRKPAPVLWQVLNVELQATTSSISFFNTALINLGVLNASKLLSESVFDPSKLLFSGKLLSVIGSIRNEFKQCLAQSKALASRIRTLEGYQAEGTVPDTLKVKIPSLVDSDKDVQQLEVSVLSGLYEHTAAASKAALEVMLSAKKKTKAALDQRMSAVDTSTLFDQICSKLSCRTEETANLSTAEREVNTAALLACYLAAVHVESLVCMIRFQTDTLPLLNAVLKPKQRTRNESFQQQDATMDELQDDPAVAPAKQSDILRMAKRIESLEVSLKKQQLSNSKAAQQRQHKRPVTEQRGRGQASPHTHSRDSSLASDRSNMSNRGLSTKKGKQRVKFASQDKLASNLTPPRNQRARSPSPRTSATHKASKKTEGNKIKRSGVVSGPGNAESRKKESATPIKRTTTKQGRNSRQ